MSRRAARVTQADIARALRAAEQTGARVRVDVCPDGTISLIPIEAAELRQPASTGRQFGGARKIVL
jgi:hypothetical protein